MHVAGGHVPPSLFWPRGPGVMKGGGGGGGTTDLVQFMKVCTKDKIPGLKVSIVWSVSFNLGACIKIYTDGVWKFNNKMLAALHNS